VCDVFLCNRCFSCKGLFRGYSDPGGVKSAKTVPKDRKFIYKSLSSTRKHILDNDIILYKLFKCVFIL
jgi:hypothetical protein